jgi:hypothetical protein
MLMDKKAEIRKLLSEYSDIMPEVRQLNQNLNEIKDLRPPDTIKATAASEAKSSPTNKISDPVLDLIIKYETMAKQYVDRINELLDKKKLIETMLIQLDHLERRIIDLRYISNPTYRCDIWEWIGQQVHYSKRQVIRTHDYSLEKLLRWYTT